MPSLEPPKTPTTPTPTTTEPLDAQLKRLGLLRLADDLDDFTARATRTRLSPRAILEQAAATELHDRARRSVERRLKRARLARFKTMADWDWNWPKSIDKKTVERLFSLDFLDRAENVVFVAPQGLGKTTLAKNIAYHAVLAGRSALFTTASELVSDLAQQDSARALDRRLRHYSRPAALVIDEIGYLSFDAHAADLLFQVVSRRYEERSLILTTNLAFKQWHTVFPNASCAVALIDRLTHHAHIIPIQGDSYRLRQAQGR